MKHGFSKPHDHAETALELPSLILLQLRSYSSLSRRCSQLYSATCSALLYQFICCSFVLYQFLKCTLPVAQLYYTRSSSVLVTVAQVYPTSSSKCTINCCSFVLYQFFQCTLPVAQLYLPSTHSSSILYFLLSCTTTAVPYHN